MDRINLDWPVRIIYLYFNPIPSTHCNGATFASVSMFAALNHKGQGVDGIGLITLAMI